MSSLTPFEKPTDELQQVRRHVAVGIEGIPVWQHDEIDVVVSIQRKWLIQVGELYDAAHPRTPSDIIVRRSESFHKDGLRAGNIGHWYCATREEWRDLPIA